MEAGEYTTLHEAFAKHGDKLLPAVTAIRQKVNELRIPRSVAMGACMMVAAEAGQQSRISADNFGRMATLALRSQESAAASRTDG